MKKVFLSLCLAVTVACASFQKTEFKTASAAVAGVEAARLTYHNLYVGCIANPASTTLCPQIVAAHDSLAKEFVVYQGAVKTLADANIAVINAKGDPATDGKVAAAISGLIQVATDFVQMQASATGGK